MPCLVGLISLLHNLELRVEGHEESPPAVRPDIVFFKGAPTPVLYVDSVLSVATDAILLADGLARLPNRHAGERISVYIILFYDGPPVVMHVDAPRLREEMEQFVRPCRTHSCNYSCGRSFSRTDSC